GRVGRGRRAMRGRGEGLNDDHWRSRRGTVRLSGPLDPVRLNEEVGWNFPCFADLVNHLDRERTPARENFGSARARAQELSQLGLGVAKLRERIVKHVNRIKTRADLDWPPFCLVYLDKRREHIELVAFLGALRRTPAGFDLSERCAVIFVGTNRP